MSACGGSVAYGWGMAGNAIRLNGAQLHRAVMASGGLWTVAQIAKATACSRMTIWHQSNGEDFPSPVTTVGPNAFFAGEEVLDYFERHERYYAAQRFAEAITQVRRRQRYGPRR
jgi:predicted DNA-binding transcriptional regulator AlpA